MPFDLISVVDNWCRSEGIPTRVFQKIESTTLNAKAEAESADGTVVYLAREQTAGRGRGSNSWQANPGDAILASISFATKRTPQPIMTPLVGLAMFEAISKAWPKLNFSLKAPNDIYLNNKKVIGILLDAIEGAQRRLIVSFGFNVLSAPPSVATATSLLDHHRELTPEELQKFISLVMVNFQEAVDAGVETQMSQKSCDNICKALNFNPNLLDKVVSVKPDGSIISASGLKRWQDL